MCAAAGHGRVTEGVDVGLDHQIGKADDGILHAGGQAEAENGFQKCRVKPDLAEPQAVILLDAHQPDAAQQGADTLGNGGGQGSGANAVAQIRNKEHIQHHIDEGGEDQVIQRMLAVTDGMEDAHENIVQHREDHAV